MAAAPLRYQVLGGVAILLYAGGIGTCSMGVRSVLTTHYAMPACEQICHSHNAGAARDVSTAGKGEHSSCGCSSGVRFPSSEGNTAVALGFFVPAVFGIASLALVAYVLVKRANKRKASS